MDNVRLFVFNLSLGLVWVCDIELPHMGKINGNPDLVREKFHKFLLACGLSHVQVDNYGIFIA